MGYRQLLKEYMEHVNGVLGTDLVELATVTSTMGKRNIAELRVLASEINRESFKSKPGPHHNQVVQTLLLHGEINLEQLANIEGVDPSDAGDEMSEEAFKRALLTLIEFSDATKTNTAV